MFTYKFFLLLVAILIILTLLFNKIKVDSFDTSDDSHIEFGATEQQNDCEPKFFPDKDPSDDIMVGDNNVNYDNYSEQIETAAVLNDSHCFRSKNFGYNEDLDKLVETVTNGLGGMPPMGMCMDCSQEELSDAVQYMLDALD